MGNTLNGLTTFIEGLIETLISRAEDGLSLHARTRLFDLESGFHRTRARKPEPRQHTRRYNVSEHDTIEP